MKANSEAVKAFLKNWGFHLLLLIFMAYYYSLPVPA